MIDDPTRPDRRAWLRKGVLFTLVGTALTAFGGILADVWRAAGHFSSAHWTEVAPVETFGADGAWPFPERRVAVIGVQGRLAALSLECTHLGCLVNVTDQGFYCPCHGSEFGPRGEVYSGPAKTSLPWHAVRIDRGRLWIHTGAKREEPVWADMEIRNQDPGTRIQET